MKLKHLLAVWIFLGCAASYLLGYTPLIITAMYFLLSCITFIVYAKDKSAAKTKRWRVPENTLHALALCGGWPGAAVAQEMLRHKTQKTSFLLLFWLTVALNSALFVGMHLSPVSDAMLAALASTEQALQSLGDGAVGRFLSSLLRVRAS